MSPIIFEYIDYRKFLADFYSTTKQQSCFFSYQYMAFKVKMDCSNLAKVLMGKRHLPVKSIPYFKELCKFKEQEFEYFTTMIEWAKTRSEPKARSLFDRLTSIQGARPHILDTMQYEYYRKWYHTAIYSLLDIIEFKGSYRNLVSYLDPPVSIEDAKESVVLLVKLGLVVVDQNGRFVPAQKTLSTGAKWKSYAIHQFQKETMELALRSLEQHNKEDRDISTLTFSASKADLEAIKKLTSDYRRSIIELISAASNAEQVYQLNMQVFPLTIKKD